jgi:hypothetical protein
MTKEDLASLLNGREYGEEITKLEEAQAKNNGLVVVFGYSDDNMEFRGAINDEVSCYGGGSAFISDGDLLPNDHECDCDFCEYKNRIKHAKKIEAVWGGATDYSWTYATNIPHATFEVMEGSEKYCLGIVFELPK